jgi:ABC-type branched-subunit amino acid transport system substrate-binding protein
MPWRGRPIEEARRAGVSCSRRSFAVLSAAFLAGCTGTPFSPNDVLSSSQPAPVTPAPALPPPPPPNPGGVRVGLILPTSAGGNAGAAAQAMRNAADMAIAEFNGPNIQLLAKDDAGTTAGAQAATQEAIDQGAEILLGPLFAHSVAAARQQASGRGVPIIAFSTDTSVAAPGVYLLSFLPESDVDRVVSYAASQGKHSFIALLPSNAYGSVVEAEFRQVVTLRGGRVAALQHYAEGRSKVDEAVRVVASAVTGADALFLADSGEPVGDAITALMTAGVNLRRLVPLGTQLWDDPRIFANPALEGGWYPAPDPAGFRAFAGRYRSRYGQEPPRPAALAYDAVALVAALAKTQAPGQRFSADTLTNPSGFAGIDGVFRFRRDGTNQRGLAIMRVTPNGPEVIASAPRTFNA